MRKHKIFQEFHRECDAVYFRLDIPKYNEHYIGIGKTITDTTVYPLGIKFTREDYQSLTMVDCPTTLISLMKAVVENSGTYDEATDKCNKLDVPNIVNDSITGFIKATMDMMEELSKNLDTASPEFKMAMDNAMKLIQTYEEVQDGHWKKRLSPTAKALMDTGFVPIWVENAIRTRIVTMVKHLDDNSLLIAQVKEFILRDSRNANNFLTMNSMVLTEGAAKEYLNS